MFGGTHCCRCVDVNKQDEDGRTVLWITAGFGHKECVQELIAAGAEINKEDNDCRTALYMAARGGHVECLKGTHDCRG